VPELPIDDDVVWFDFSGSGSPVLLVPGLSGSAAFWDPQLPAFTRRHLVVTHDHRGTGRSGRQRMHYSIEQMANDVLALADHLNIDSFHYVGHSTGGAMGQHLAVHHPERIRSLVLSSTWPGQDSYFQSLFTLRRDVLRDMGMNAYKRIASLMMKPPRHFARDALQTITSTSAEETKLETSITLSRVQALLDFDLRDRLSEIQIPTLVICAEDDVVTPPHCSREIATRIAGAELHMMERGGHFYAEIDPGAFTGPVLDFIERFDRKITSD